MLKINDLENKNNSKSLLEFCKKDDKKIILMPSGAHAAEVLENYLSEFNIKCVFFVDNNKNKHGEKINGIEIISPEKLYSIKDEVKIIFATNLEIYEVLKKQIEPYNMDYTYAPQQYCIYTVNEIHNASKILKQNYKRYENLYNMLGDELSRKTLDNHLMFRMDYSRQDLIDEIMQKPENQYFEDGIYKISNKDSIIDCGAYTGDTLENALSRINGEFKNYYAFEPDSKNFEVLKKKHKNIEAFNCGVSNQIQTLYIQSKGTSITKLGSQDTGSGKIEVSTLDETLKNKDVTFIKMDIEGAEISALTGAKEIIKSKTPALAICVYHKFNDIFDIPELIKSINPDYKFYLRHYSSYISETVLYAVR